MKKSKGAQPIQQVYNEQAFLIGEKMCNDAEYDRSRIFDIRPKPKLSF